MRSFVCLWMVMLGWQVAAQTPGTVPQWQFALIKMPGAPGEFVVAQAMERRESGILFLSWKGSRVAIQPDYVVAVVAGPVGRPIDWTPEEWQSVRAQLERVAERHPGYREQIDRQMAELSEATDQARSGLTVQQWAQMKSMPYQPETSLREALQLVNQAEQLAARNTEIASEVVEWVKPWKEHVKRLQGGQVYRNGQWQQKVASTTSTSTAPTSTASNAQTQLPAASVDPDDQVTVNTEVENAGKMLIVLIAIGVMVLVMGLIVLAGLRAIWLRMSGQSDQGILLTIPLTLVVLAILAATAFYGYKLLAQPQTVASWRGDQQAAPGEWHAMQRAFGPGSTGGGQGEITFSAAAANRALAEWLTWTVPAEPGMALYRTGWAVAPADGAWLVAEEFRLMNRPFVVTYRIPVAVPGGKESRVEILANGLPLPPWIAARFWESMQAEKERLREALSWRFGVREGQVVANPK